MIISYYMGADFLRFTAFFGFIVTATLIINLNFRAFKIVFKENTRKYWWLFLISAMAPMLIIIYIFSLLFSR